MPEWGETLKAIKVQKEQFIKSEAGEVPAGQPAARIYQCSAPAGRRFVVHILQLPARREDAWGGGETELQALEGNFASAQGKVAASGKAEK